MKSDRNGKSFDKGKEMGYTLSWYRAICRPGTGEKPNRNPMGKKAGCHAL